MNSAEESRYIVAGDDRVKAANSCVAAILVPKAIQSFVMAKKCSLEGQGSLSMEKSICPIHAEPVNTLENADET